MHLPILAIVVTLTAAMSVSACYGEGHTCKDDSDCCAADDCVFVEILTERTMCSRQLQIISWQPDS
ncbi:hypothetical protein K503DRAFT_776052 [Rhizopogon vinicolor AM-OR11-026]|uniref:Uncharacterized protein n=1 Tax=Rhizopogon vinicolor AM-OR11-026 TaxID=1314800 RepID=A0A1B7MK92_9AGAM|nr:hypothetical protein K503DRAFT_776052 [Rhizopogon vinicolor AM-OR11-026]